MEFNQTAYIILKSIQQETISTYEIIINDTSISKPTAIKYVRKLKNANYIFSRKISKTNHFFMTKYGNEWIKKHRGRICRQ